MQEAPENPYEPIRTPRRPTAYHGEPLSFRSSREELHKGPSGLGGWLVLPAIGLGLTLLSSFAGAMQAAVLFNSPETSPLLAPDSAQYMAMLHSTLLIELIGNGVLGLAAAGLLVLYFLRSRWFPGLFIAYMAGRIVLGLVHFAAYRQLPLEGGPDISIINSDLTAPIVAALIWIPYMLNSSRVKNTFGKR